MSGGSPASDFSVALLGELIATGVRDIVLSPGSRSQALALAAAQYERAGLVRLRVRIDERVAGFLALGLAVETRTPVLIITTSGTAVANLHPAVLEAHHSGVPLILLTADRPADLRGIGSNQTTDQLDIFGSSVHFVRDVEPPGESGTDEFPAELAREAFAAAAGHSSAVGPVQLNLAFREPLSSAVDPGALLDVSREPEHETPGSIRPHRPQKVATVSDAAGTVVIAGHDAGAVAEELARKIGAPLLAEVTSGARFGPNLVVAYRELLADPGFGGQVRRAVVFGHPTLTREVPALLQRPDVETIVVRGRAFEDYDPGRRAAMIADVVEYTGDPLERSWAGRWVQASRNLLTAQSSPDPVRPVPALPDPLRSDRLDPAAPGEFARSQLARFRAPVTRKLLAETVWQATWPHDRLVVGASRLIRDLDRSAPGKRITVHANRGLAGIDGTIATAIGIALASQAPGDGNGSPSGAQGTTRLLLGDLALLHDIGALLFGLGEHRPRLQVIVGNDGGGTIFDGLEVAATADTESFDRVLYTPHSADLSALAAAYGWTYRRASNRGELDESLTASDGTVLIEVPLSRR